MKEDFPGIDQEGDHAWLFISEAGKEVSCINLSVTELHVFILHCQAVETALVAFLETRQKRTMHLGSAHIHDEQERDILVYRGTLNDGRVICVDKDVFEMSKFNRYDDAEWLNNPDEWLESLDGECVFIEGHFLEAK